MVKRNGVFWQLALCAGISGCADGGEEDGVASRVFVQATIANISAPGALTTSVGPLDVLLAPGVWAVHAPGSPLVEAGREVGQGLEAAAEEGDPAALQAELLGDDDVASSAIFGTRRPGENYAENPLEPGEEVSFEFWADADQTFSFVAMYVHSNDVVAGIGEDDGMVLDQLEIGVPYDLSLAVRLWDVGTETNEEPGVGPTQPARQPAPGAGGVEGGKAAVIDGVDASGFTYPVAASFVSVALQRMQ